MDITTVIFSSAISTLISTGVITIILQHNFDKKIRTHELKLEKYFTLIEELSKLTGTGTGDEKLLNILNSTLFFSSDNVCREILRFNKVFTEKREDAVRKNSVYVSMTEKDIKPLIKAIRTELYLKSQSIDEEGLRFFQKPVKTD